MLEKQNSSQDFESPLVTDDNTDTYGDKWRLMVTNHLQCNNVIHGV